MKGQHVFRWGWPVTMFTIALALLPTAAWACAVCWDGDDALARGMNSSILFLMSMPFIIFGSIFSTVYITQKRAQKPVGQGLAGTQKERTT